ncbi:BadM/Rrf2 family transcriptional regulator [Anaeroplasma bactoclasticum]|jgi:Rrf2 family protein|uniref:BadM/Rrf2 family transcriptional regulator n=1 Tax=Anaeroplasma bactoclasticum TaxID=2088 RepID=A0A397S0E0_9MOLU|nr:Rrf2 family transcriptional regulator [Anaeroplasma bactoclasticum]RIA77865.1 BadM/Rrf2 family transcriptional regulator [Anaeroplasma bactoclasticum]
MISTKGRYALRLMIDIAAYSNGGVVSLKDSSKRQDISIKYLEQVVALLTRGGLLISVRGNNGGYRLTKRPEEYTAGEILRCAEGTLAPVACLQCNKVICDRAEICATIDFWKGFNEVITNYVDSVTLDDLAKKEKGKIGNDYSI